MKYWPIGTVLTLYRGTKPLMIFGRRPTQENTGIEWDYVACLYPEGYLGDGYNVFFQQEEIGEILFCGWETREEEVFEKLLHS